MTSIPALVQQLTSEARGSVGAFTFSRNRDGSYVRARTVPTDPASFAQQAQRLRMTQSSSRWATLISARETALWKSYAAQVDRHNALGKAFHDQGRNWFLAMDLLRTQCTHASIFKAPRQNRRTHLSDFDCRYFTLTDIIRITPNPNDEWRWSPNDLMILFQSPAVSSAVTYHRAPFRYLGHIHGNQALPANFRPVFPIPGGNWFFIRARALTVNNYLSRSVYSRGAAF